MFTIQHEATCRLRRCFCGAPNLGFSNIQFLLRDCGKTSSDLQRNINVFTGLGEDSCVT